MPDITSVKTLSHRPRTVEANFLRRDPNAVHLVDDETRAPGTIYTEYIEIWKRLDDDELSANRERISQVASGRRFEYIDEVAWGYAGLHFTDDLPFVVSPSNFAVHRLRAV